MNNRSKRSEVLGEPATTIYNLLAELGFEYLHPGGPGLSMGLYKELGLSSTDNVLVAGCGTGQALVTLAKKYLCQVTGIELSLDMLRRSANKVARFGINRSVILERGDIRHMSFDDGNFSAVLDEGVLMFSEPEAALAEYVRVTRPGGRVGLLELSYVAEPSDSQRAALGRALGGGNRTGAHSVDGWKKLMQQAGLENIKVISGPLHHGAGHVFADEGPVTWLKTLLHSALDPNQKKRLDGYFDFLAQGQSQMCCGVFIGCKSGPVS